MSYGVAGRNGLSVSLLSVATLATSNGPFPTLDLEMAIDGSFPSTVTYTGASLKMDFDATGKLTYGPNNLTIFSLTPTDASWLATRTTKTTGQADPFGGTNAALITGDGTVANNHYLQGPNTAVVSGVTYVVSEYLKGGTANFIQVWLVSQFPANTYVNFDLNLGTKSNGVGVTTSSITAVSGFPGWYRISFVATANATGTSQAFSLIGNSLADGANPVNASTGTFSEAGIAFEAVTYQTTPGTLVSTGASAYYGPRFGYDPVTLAPLGYLSEEQRTNLALQASDLTNAAYTKSNMTTAKTATGPDGAANSATTCTATAGNATALQAITSGSAARVTSVYLKRRTGSGNIDITQDNGSTWTTITLGVGWTSAASPVATAANPTIGLRIVTNADAVDVWNFQHELTSANYPGPTSPIPTTSATVTRAADLALMTSTNFSSWYNALTGTFVTQFRTPSALGTAPVFSADDNGANNNIVVNTVSTDPKFLVTSAGVVQANIDAGTVAASTSYKMATSYVLNDFEASIAGGVAVVDSSGTVPTVDRLRIGVNQAGAALNDHIASLKYYNTAIPVQAAST